MSPFVIQYHHLLVPKIGRTMSRLHAECRNSNLANPEHPAPELVAVAGERV